MAPDEIISLLCRDIVNKQRKTQTTELINYKNGLQFGELGVLLAPLSENNILIILCAKKDNCHHKAMLRHRKSAFASCSFLQQWLRWTKSMWPDQKSTRKGWHQFRVVSGPNYSDPCNFITFSSKYYLEINIQIVIDKKSYKLCFVMNHILLFIHDVLMMV